MIFHSHFFSMVFFALIVSIVLPTLKEESLKARVREGAILFVTLVFGAVLAGWLMFLFR